MKIVLLGWRKKRSKRYKQFLVDKKDIVRQMITKIKSARLDLYGIVSDLGSLFDKNLINDGYERASQQRV